VGVVAPLVMTSKRLVIAQSRLARYAAQLEGD